MEHTNTRRKRLQCQMGSCGSTQVSYTLDSKGVYVHVHARQKAGWQRFAFDETEYSPILTINCSFREVAGVSYSMMHAAPLK